MSFIQDDLNELVSIRNERLYAGLFLLVFVAFILFDILDDWHEGIESYHILVELLLSLGGLVLACCLFTRWVKHRRITLGHAREEVANAKRAANEWRDKAAKYRAGLTAAISAQLDAWQLTEAEKEISFLLLKGFSLQEIADLRQTSERTVRQQSSIIYKKSGLSGRVQLAAFFLEDFLFGPSM